jgi:hypothetical protein
VESRSAIKDDRSGEYYLPTPQYDGNHFSEVGKLRICDHFRAPIRGYEVMLASRFLNADHRTAGLVIFGVLAPLHYAASKLSSLETTERFVN